jgi:hypothetical protein
VAKNAVIKIIMKMNMTLFLRITRAMEFQNPKLKIFDIAGFYAPAKV